MKTILFTLLACLVISSVSFAQVTISGDTSYISGSTFAGVGYLGEMDSTISSDTTSTGARKNPNAVYALYEGQVYFQLTPIYYNNPTGTLTIVGVPDPKNPAAKTKPIILIQPTDGEVPSNTVYGSITIKNVHWQVMELNGNLQSELFYCGTRNQHPQELILDNDLFEFSNTDIFDCTNESGAIGGWPYGAKFFITNCYFRNMFEPGQWWSSRVFQCKHPIDTLWVENCTVTTGGLTFLQQNELTDFAYFNHNTIINNKKYWLLSPYHRSFFVTNNIFINQNWVGEDTNLTSSGSPYRFFMSTIILDSVNDGEGVLVQPKYEGSPGDSTTYSPLLALNKMQVYISNNINYYDSLLINGYYKSSTYILADTGSPPVTYGWIPSYLGWYYPGVQKVENIPGEWENTGTQAILAAYSPAKGGGMIEEHTTTPSTSPISYGMTSSVVTAMAQWNQHQYGDPRFPSPTPALTSTPYIYGDYNPQTLPGILGGVKTDAITNKTTINSGDQVGISKFTDLTENFSQSMVTSTIDGFHVGSLIWDDTQNAAYAAAHANELATVLEDYYMSHGPEAVKPEAVVATAFNLAQNFPNPFNPSTVISYQLPANTLVTLQVYDVLGRLVRTLIEEHQPAGNHSVTFSAINLSSGVYFYRLTAGSFIATKKLMLTK